MCVSCNSLARLSQGIKLYNWLDKALVRPYIDNNLLLKAEQIHNELKEALASENGELSGYQRSLSYHRLELRR